MPDRCMIHPALSLVTAVPVLAVAAVVATSSSSQPAQHAYPAKGRSEARQAKDAGDCSTWATRQTGYDPANPPCVAEAKPAPVTGSGARVRGAAMGGVVGGITDGDVGDSMMRGAVVGGVVKRVRNRRVANEANEANQAQVQAAANSWAQARGACLNGRGYTVN
jgi:hypothetical protein